MVSSGATALRSRLLPFDKTKKLELNELAESTAMLADLNQRIQATTPGRECLSSPPLPRLAGLKTSCGVEPMLE